MLTDDREIVNNLKKLAQDNDLSHAYLFWGGDERDRQEKFIFALSLANFLERGTFEKPSQLLRDTLVISSKIFFEENKTVNISFFPDANEKEKIGIDNIRVLKYFLWQKPINSLRRVVIIREAENLTHQAQNASLKIVEDPPASALIIFIARTEDCLFLTLSSRLQKIYFPQKRSYRDNQMESPDQKRENVPYSYSNLFVDSDEIANWGLLSEIEIDRFFEGLISDFKKNSVKNSEQLKEVLKHFVLMKQFNTNKRLQLRALISKIRSFNL